MGMVSGVFAHQRDQTYSRKCQENKAGYLQPELVQHAAEVAQSGFGPVQHGSIGARPFYLLPGNSRRNTQFPSRRDVCHSSRFYQGRALE